MLQRAGLRPSSGHVRTWTSLLSLAAVLLAPSCRITDHSEKDPDAITPDALNIPTSGFETGDAAELPTIAFDSTTLAMGRIAQGSQVEKVFRFVNTGKKDLIITDVRGTCGCTVGKDWPKAPVHPGQGGTITVRFDSEGRSGAQTKTVTVVANTQPATTVLTLTGEVIAPPGQETPEPTEP